MVTLLAAAVLWCAAPARAAPPPYVNNESAAIAVGQKDLVTGGVNGSPGVAASGLFGAGGIWSDGTHLIVADTNNNRVKIYNSVPGGSGIDADVVVGQPDFSSNLANQGGAAPAANTLSGPTGVFYDAANDRLFIADTGNHRVLIFNALPALNNTAADVVVGQPDFLSATANQGLAAPTAQTLSSPAGVYSNGNDCYIADKSNNRVLVFSAVPGVNDAFAAFTVGQTTFNVNQANMGGAVNAFTLSGPQGVWSDGVALYVADTGNSRALIYSVIPATNAVSANFAAGQPNLTSGLSNQGGAAPTSRTLSLPQSIAKDAGGRLIVADTSNNRALIWAAVPAANNAAASFVVGQTTFNVKLANQGGAVSATGLSAPAAAVSDNALLYVADRSNNRGLIYSPIPGGNGNSATTAVGQTDLVTGTANQATTTPSAAGMFRPTAAKFDAARLYVADRVNSRVLIYNSVPRVLNPSADVAIGQASMGVGSSNQGLAAPTAQTLSFPNDVYSDGAKLYVADQANNRVLVYNAIPSANNANAAFVLGQSSFTQSAFNGGGTVRAFTLGFPSGVIVDGTHLLVADRFNHRVLSYTLPIATNTVSAALALGQPGKVTNTVNQAGVGAASSLNAPSAVFSTGTMVFVADTSNNRVLIWNAFPAGDGAPANVVVGQTGFGAANVAANQGLAAPTSQTLSRPASVWSDGSSLYVGDTGNNRLLVYNPIPSANNAAASLVIGQAAMTTAKPNQGAGVAANTLSGPTFVSVDSATGRMFIADTNANRITLYYPAAVSSVTTAGGAFVLNSAIGPAQVTATVPPFAFGGGVITLTFSAQTGFPAAQSAAATLTGTGVGFQADLAPAVQPNQQVLLNVIYKPADLAGFDTSKLLLARFDSVAQTWVPLPSAAAPSNNTVFARTDHFSLFQLMQAATGANTPSTVVAFPNPLQPSAGQNQMTFASAPPFARLRIYTLTGALIKDLSADGVGMATWDGTNASGAKVASGVYFVFVQGGGQKRTLKVAIER